MAFQITDDILDVEGDHSMLGKPVGRDLVQGVLSLPLLLARRGPAVGGSVGLTRNGRRQRSSAKSILSRRTSDEALDECRRLARRYGLAAVEALECLPSIPARRSLKQLADWVVERQQ
jgi:heptaprenyl diphosphate synthase